MKKIQQYLLSLGIVGLVSAAIYIGTIDPKTGFPAPITVDGQTITFTWTDDNTGEDLIIYTDKATYNNSLSEAEVYVAVENRSGIDQDIELLGYFRDNTKQLADVSVLTELVREREEPVYTEVCTPIVATTTDEKLKEKMATSTCDNQQTGTRMVQFTELKWVPLPVIERSVPRMLEEDMKVDAEKRKSVENFIAEKKTEPYEAKAGEVTYYKVRIKFPPASEDNFYFEALGSQGAMGHLDPWFDSNWNYRVKVEVNRTKVGTTTAVTSFPVYLDLDLMPAGFWSNVSATGSDIRVVESDETTETAFDLVSFATTTTQGELHFMADSLGTTSTSTFYVYYGNPAASAYTATSTYGRNNVWTTYNAKWHLSESSGNATDSTSNGNTAANVNTVTYTTSQIYNGANFVRTSSQHLDATDSASLSITGNNTISFWLYMSALPASGAVYGLITKDTAGSSNREWWADYYNTGSAYQLRMGIHSLGTSGRYSYSFLNYTFATSTWYKVDIKTTVANAAATKFEFFVNGVSQGNGTGSDTGGTNTSIANGTNPVVLGGYNTTGVYFDGRLDEVGITASLLSNAWLLTEYNNQSSPSTFTIIGAQETKPASGGGTDIQSIFWFD